MRKTKLSCSSRISNIAANEMDVPALYILDVGHGNSAVLVDVSGTVIIDAGPRTALLEFLMQEGIKRVDAVLLSHADKDHVEGLISLIESETVEIGRVRLNTDLVKKTNLWAQLMFILDKCHRESKIDFDVALTTRNSGEFDQENVQVEILAPSLRVAGTGVGSMRNGKKMLKSNSISAVIRLVVNKKPWILLCGDLDEAGLDELLQDTPSPKADVLVFPHHGGNADSSEMENFAKRLCNVVKPRTVVFSIGRGLHSTPIPDVVKAVRKRDSEVRIACTQLSEHCATSIPDSTPKHLLDVFASGKETNKCCTGSIMVRLGDVDAAPDPPVLTHLAFIDQHAPNALCRR